MQTPLEAITLPALHSRTRMTQILLVTFHVPAVHVAPSQISSLSQVVGYDIFFTSRHLGTDVQRQNMRGGVLSREFFFLDGLHDLSWHSVANGRNIRQRSRRLCAINNIIVGFDQTRPAWPLFEATTIMLTSSCGQIGYVRCLLLLAWIGHSRSSSSVDVIKNFTGCRGCASQGA